MIKLHDIETLENNGGLTIRAYESITYESGWQVADYGIECHTANEVLAAVKAMGGDAGIWYADGVFYVDHSFRVETREEAMEIGRAHNQISVLNWSDMTLAYCNE